MKSRPRWWLIAGSLAGVALAALTAGSALADVPPTTTATVTATVNVAVRSVSVSPTSVDFCTTADPLQFPNGACKGASSVITVTNGSAGGHIDIQGAPAVPTDLGKNWTLVNTGTPGQDQYKEHEYDSNGGGPWLTGSPQCDTLWVTGPIANKCVNAAPGQAVTASFWLIGPSASTDPSAQFTTTITWTAVP